MNETEFIEHFDVQNSELLNATTRGSCSELCALKSCSKRPRRGYYVSSLYLNFRQDNWQRLSPLLRHPVTCHKVSWGLLGTEVNKARLYSAWQAPSESLKPALCTRNNFFDTLILFYLDMKLGLLVWGRSRDWGCLRTKCRGDGDWR